nr:MAG: hypothetical protein [Molluscum contagiosum virus]
MHKHGKLCQHAHSLSSRHHILDRTQSLYTTCKTFRILVT